MTGALLDGFQAQLDDPAFVTAMCEDYRAGASADRDPLEPWRALAPGIAGRAVEGASHFLVEDAPEAVGADLAAFFGAGL